MKDVPGLLDNGNAVTSTSREMIRYAEAEGNKFYNTKLDTIATNTANINLNVDKINEVREIFRNKT